MGELCIYLVVLWFERLCWNLIPIVAVLGGGAFGGDVIEDLCTHVGAGILISLWKDEFSPFLPLPLLPSVMWWCNQKVLARGSWVQPGGAASDWLVHLSLMENMIIETDLKELKSWVWCPANLPAPPTPAWFVLLLCSYLSSRIQIYISSENFWNVLQVGEDFHRHINTTGIATGTRNSKKHLSQWA